MNQNFNGYYIFYRVAQIGNISHASEVLYISQPAVSKAVTKLEEQLGTQLFRRIPRGVELTSDGEKLFEKLETAFCAIEDGERELTKNVKAGLGRLRLGTSATMCRYLLMPYLEEYVTLNPLVKTQISCQSSAQTIKLIEQGEIDVGLVTSPVAQSTLEFIPATEIEDIFVASRSYLDTITKGDRSDSTERILERANVMLLDEKNSSRVYIDSYLRENRISLTRIMEVTNMELLIDFARIGMGVACVIKKFAQDDINSGRLCQLELSNPVIKRTAGFAYKQSYLAERGVNTFIKLARDRLEENK